ncbi:hypothetical protein F5Y07DRAFT_234562 [Xylaria sp. FL0933]|nr:hypothetical protein F5Y07DRAFT_234562 [Xylaria sp. FL0933]
MEDKKSELLQYAREYATANKDLYELLSVPADAAQPEVHRAWRKASLKHHPDKAKVFDPEIWQLFERARDVLSSPEARSAYDAARAAAVQAQKARAALDAKRRAMIDDLEARERGVKRKVDGEGMDGRHMMTVAEKRVLMEKGREHLEKRRRMKEEAEARERQRERESERESMRMKEDRAGSTLPREPERRPTQPSSAHIPTPSAPASANTVMEDIDMQQTQPPPDEYDERIADIERRLRERKAEKAARKAGKKSTKARRDESSNITANGNGEATTSDPTTTTTRTTPPPAATTEKPAPPSTSIPNFPTTTTTHFRESNTTPGDFSSTMAKLRAAQREKERKRAEAEAAAATAATATAASDG